MHAQTNKTDVQRLLDDLTPGEKREHVRSQKPKGTEGRFWLVARSGEISSASLLWLNDQPRPTDEGVTPSIALEQLDQPVFQADPEESPIGDLYRIESALYLLRSTIVNCLSALDRDSAKHRKAETRGLGTDADFYLTQLRRRLDAIDVSKTNMILHYKQIIPTKQIYRKVVYFPKGLCLREDIPANVHCFVEHYSGQLLFSTELLNCLREAGARGIYARHPTADETGVAQIDL